MDVLQLWKWCDGAVTARGFRKPWNLKKNPLFTTPLKIHRQRRLFSFREIRKLTTTYNINWRQQAPSQGVFVPDVDHTVRNINVGKQFLELKTLTLSSSIWYPTLMAGTKQFSKARWLSDIGIIHLIRSSRLSVYSEPEASIYGSY